jgi:hypothetical protein
MSTSPEGSGGASNAAADDFANRGPSLRRSAMRGHRQYILPTNIVSSRSKVWEEVRRGHRIYIEPIVPPKAKEAA